ncbi:unnamed protein product [Phytophthora fragariaefolia]|uniref:Unnamed protein product n=1 Tax=Phytophthora fragariaefolia TaxID=1490495 RepID=A0A9W6XY34_9STRA|nr:unnamed protein product [Phytophthora fragariaefolia]
MLDRRAAGGRQTENEALTTLVIRYQFTDARNLIGHAEEDLDLEELNRYTFWRGDSASNVEEIRERTLLRVGLHLEENSDKVRWRFRRTAIWERDQRVTAISAPPSKTSLNRPVVCQHLGATVQQEPQIHTNPGTGSSHRQIVRIPPDRKVSHSNNELLMAEIDEAELTQAVRSLQRHKVAGPDGLNNDFYKDLTEEVLPALVDVCNNTLKGEPPPKSFLEGTVIPLRKKGDSADAMDYRPIMLLQTSCKIFMKVIAPRLQSFLGKLIGDTQQGFVRKRQMQKTIQMMLTISQGTEQLGIRESTGKAGIFLLDFQKAYDTMDRQYLLEVLKKSGFSAGFVSLIQRLHTGTTVRFAVNGETSESVHVNSGIRQGCPLAPLLFILGAEVLGLAKTQDECITGIPLSRNQMRQDISFQHSWTTPPSFWTTARM